MLNGDARVMIDGVEYRLVFDINAMADFESVTERDAFDALTDLESGRMRVTDMRAMFWSTFQAHHPEVDLRQAGTLLTKAPQALGEVVGIAMPKPADATKGARAGNRKAAKKTA